MNLSSIIKLSFISLRSNKTRSFLTMLGIIIGISSVIIIMSVGAGAQSLIFSQIEKVGSNLVGIMPGAADKDGPPAIAYGITVTTLKTADAEAILKQVPEVLAVAAFVQGNETITWQNQKISATFLGTMASYTSVEDVTLVQGRFFSESEEKGVARVVVLGSKAAHDLFGDQDPLGQHLKIKRESFEVIGVIKERGSVGFQSPDSQVFLPISSGQKLLLGINYLHLIRAKIRSSEEVPQAIVGIKEVLRARHNIQKANNDDFDVRDQAEALAALSTITNALKFFLAAIAAISLLVGGVGIMNIMYVAVTERTREIGLRKAVGAQEGSILKQFLVEAMILTSLAGIIGVLLGAGVAGLVALVAGYLGYAWEFIVSPLSIAVSVAVSAGIGIIFGYFPAKRAAHLDPIEALRYE
ncbi:MAG: ABC transporter permease [Patescibacteria group bacterium]|jgi:putative ABC transport system permease protein